jgi:Spy/CpxP family protein refolding chaperone
MNTKLLSAFALAAVLVAPAFAGRPGGARGDDFRRDSEEFGEKMAERHAERLTRALDLSDAQQATLATLQESFGEAVRPLFTSMRESRDQMETLLDQANPDPAEVGTRAIALHRAKQSMKAAQEKLESDIEAMLDDTQRAQFQALRDARGEHDRFDRRGFRGRD